MRVRSHTSPLTPPWKPVQVNHYPLQRSMLITCIRMIEMLPGHPGATKQCDLVTLAGSCAQREERVGLPSEIIKIGNRDISRVKKVKIRNKNLCCCISELFHLGLSYLCNNFSECFLKCKPERIFYELLKIDLKFTKSPNNCSASCHSPIWLCFS